jgi:hypothetical protein
LPRAIRHGMVNNQQRLHAGSATDQALWQEGAIVIGYG